MPQQNVGKEKTELASMDVNNPCFKFFRKKNQFGRCFMRKEIHSKCLLDLLVHNTEIWLLGENFTVYL